MKIKIDSWYVTVFVSCMIGLVLIGSIFIHLKTSELKKQNIDVQTEVSALKLRLKNERATPKELKNNKLIATEINRRALERSVKLSAEGPNKLTKNDFKSLKVTPEVGAQLASLFLVDSDTGHETVNPDVRFDKTLTSWLNGNVYLYTPVTVTTAGHQNHQTIETVFDPTEDKLVEIRLSEFERGTK
ncbi:hypothetical protein [Weissella minor]|uniref:hypothetical protein n=1 Tax=Weissella minor TaxID=1620 RepID=UPI003AF2CF2F